jgi:hypothetical protein
MTESNTRAAPRSTWAVNTRNVRNGLKYAIKPLVKQMSDAWWSPRSLDERRRAIWRYPRRNSQPGKAQTRVNPNTKGAELTSGVPLTVGQGENARRRSLEIVTARDRSQIVTKLWNQCDGALAEGLLTEAGVSKTEARQPSVSQVWLKFDDPLPKDTSVPISLYVSLRYEEKLNSYSASGPVGEGVSIHVDSADTHSQQPLLCRHLRVPPSVRSCYPSMRVEI